MTHRRLYKAETYSGTPLEFVDEIHSVTNGKPPGLGNPVCTSLAPTTNEWDSRVTEAGSGENSRKGCFNQPVQKNKVGITTVHINFERGGAPKARNFFRIF